MKRLLLSVLLLLVTQSLFAQTTESSAHAIVTGTVLKSNGNRVPNASVALYDSPGDSTLITGTSSEVNGSFKVDVQPGEYYMEISYLSYETYSDTLDLESGETKQVANVSLNPTTAQMEEVMIRQEQSRIEMNFDSRTFDVEDLF